MRSLIVDNKQQQTLPHKIINLFDKFQLLKNEHGINTFLAEVFRKIPIFRKEKVHHSSFKKTPKAVRNRLSTPHLLSGLKIQFDILFAAERDWRKNGSNNRSTSVALWIQIQFWTKQQNVIERNAQLSWVELKWNGFEKQLKYDPK